MMAARGIPRWLMERLGQDVTVEPYAGAGPFGKTYGPPIVVRALVDNRRRRVRSASGDEVVSETTLRMQLGEECPVESRVTLPDGRQAEVITSAEIDGRSLPVPSHREVALT
ncbi:hypothetical protein ACFY19_20725 [Streptosporangium saharense]|uniref:hypothetical protein n=1 Tax=Streptosporangium saharense TaxID=1706840 RepID=UPI003697D9D7